LGTEPVTPWLIVQYLNQLHNHMPHFLHIGNKKFQYYLNQKRQNDRIPVRMAKRFLEVSSYQYCRNTHNKVPYSVLFGVLSNLQLVSKFLLGGDSISLHWISWVTAQCDIPTVTALNVLSNSFTSSAEKQNSM
jgi:hypothetical protein